MKSMILALLLLCLTAQICPAPIFGGYPGLEKLIERSDAIVVVLIMQQKTGLRVSRGGYEQFDVHFVKMLKGERPEDKVITVSLRHLSYGDNRWGFSTNTGYLLFLSKTDKKKVPYQSLNSEGAHWELGASVDPKVLDSLTIKNAIKYLLKESLESKRKELKTLEKTIESILKEKETQPENPFRLNVKP